MNDEVKAGWRISDWCKTVSISRARFYTLGAGLRPASVKVGRMHIIIEAPIDWLARISNGEQSCAKEVQEN